MLPTGIGQSAPAPITSLDPLLDNSIGSLQAWLLLYRPLAWIGTDDRLDPERSLAETITPDQSGRRFRIRLKPWRWSDGAPVTADDAVFTWQLIRRAGALYAFAGQGGIPDRIEAVQATGPRDLEITLREPTNPDWFTLNGLTAFAPLPRHAWRDPDAATLFRNQANPARATVTDGPFRLAGLAPGRYAAFVPNPTYGGHRSTLDRLVLDMVPGGSALHLAESGALDMAHLPPALAARLPLPPGFRRVPLPEAFGYRVLLYNRQTPFLADVRVRRAIAAATDQPAMIRLVYAGNAHAIAAPVPADPATWTAPGLAAPRHDPAEARRLLDEAGYAPGPDGIRARAGQRLAFAVLVSAGNTEAQQELQILQQNLRDVGVALAIRVVTEARLGAILFGGAAPWDAAVLGYTRWGVPDGSSFFDTHGAGNPGNYSDPTMDRLIAASTHEPGTAALFAYETYAAAQQPVGLLPEGGFTLQVSTALGGVENFLSPEGFWSPEYLTTTCDAARNRPPR